MTHRTYTYSSFALLLYGFANIVYGWSQKRYPLHMANNFLMKFNKTDHSDSPRLLLPLFCFAFVRFCLATNNQDLKSFYCEHYILAPQFEKQALTVNKFNLEQNVAVRRLRGEFPFHVCQKLFVKGATTVKPSTFNQIIFQSP